jgi:putative colanic acid biosynthesis UDP-glucose lipid carrier transferase
MELLEHLVETASQPRPELTILFCRKKGYRGKRLFDITLSLLLLAVTLPVAFPVLMLWIALEAGGNPFFIQERNGFNNIPFRCLKFKTMVRDKTSEKRIITKSGRWMRPLGIDELPQLFNVLKGEMSLIGPRPHTFADNRRFDQIVHCYQERNKVRPGITGLAQSKGHKGIITKAADIRIRVQYDLQYINTASLWLDLKIIMATVKGIFTENTKAKP